VARQRARSRGDAMIKPIRLFTVLFLAIDRALDVTA
jgi:hypothetical protein